MTYETPQDIVDYQQASSGIYIPKDYNFFVKPNSYDVTLRKYEEYERWSKFIQWGRKNPILFAEQLIGIEFMDYQKYIFMMSWNTPYVVWCCSRNAGKALALNTKIPTPDGSYKLMADIKVGDYVLGDDGLPTKVINTSEIFLGNKCFKVTFDDGESIIADADHLWEVQYSVIHGFNGKGNSSRIKTEVKKTDELYHSYKKDLNGYTDYVYSIPISQPIEYPDKEVPLPAYVYGLWLTMGKRAKGYLMVPEQYLPEITRKLSMCGFIVTRKMRMKNDPYNRTKISIQDSDGKTLNYYLEKYGLDLGRYIPDFFMYNSIEVRKELLTGMIDGYIWRMPGEIEEPGLISCTILSTIIGKQFGILLKDLGIKYRAQSKTGGSCTYQFYVSKENPYCSLSSLYQSLPKTTNEWQTKKTIINIEEVPSQATKCLYVDNDSHLFLCGDRNTVTHNSILGAIFIMCKTVLVPNHTTYILCDVGSQSIEMFSKIEKLTEKAIPSFKTLTDFYMGEIQRSAANTNGFVHNPASYHYETFNGSAVYTLNGNYDHNRSRRSNLNYYDEAAFIGNEEIFTTSEPFTTQSSDFGLGVGLSENQMNAQPKQFANQLIYASSAGRTDQYFFKKYREASIRMDAGDRRYFAADINSDMVLRATQRGVLLSRPLLTQETIDARMREDKEAGLREYKNIFTNEGGDGQIIRRADIIRNSKPYAPVLKNLNNKKKYIIAYDPARRHDNSVIGIAEVYQDPKEGYKMRIVNFVLLIDLLSKKRMPINTPSQVDILKQIIIDYNGEEVIDYENIEAILVDAGSGGAGVPITDFLCEDWKDHKGNVHRGLIDEEYNENDRKRYPNAVRNKLKLISPAKYKSELFEALIKMMEINAIEFPLEYPVNKGYIELIYETNKKGESTQRYDYPSEKEEEKMMKSGITVSTIDYHLTLEEEVALKQIDAAKTEAVNIYRFKQSNGKDRFDLAPEKAKKMNDDRAYVLALLAYQLAQMRRENILRPKKQTNINKMDYISVRAPQHNKRF